MCECLVHKKNPHQNLRYVYSSHPHWHTHNTRVQLKLTANTKTSGMCTNRIHTDTPTTHTPHTRHTYTTNRQAGVLHPNRTSDTFTKHGSQYTLLGITHTRTPKLQLCVQHIYCHMCYTCEMTTVQLRLNLWHIKLCGIKAWYTECRPSTLSKTHLHNTYTSSVSLLQTKKLKTCVIYITTASVQYIEYNSIQFNSIQFIDQLRALKGQQENCTQMNKQYAQ